jgi:hypothetical protein
MVKMKIWYLIMEIMKARKNKEKIKKKVSKNNKGKKQI